MNRSDVLISVVAPLYNDADIIDAFVEELRAVLDRTFPLYEIVLVDDGSSDETMAKVFQLLPRIDRVRVVQLSRRFGEEIAIAAGLDSVIGDYVAIMLPATDPPELLPEMIDQAQKGAGVVFGIRQHNPYETPLYRFGVSAFYWLCNRVVKLSIPKNTTHFRVLNRQAVTAVTQIRDRMRYLHTLSAYVGYSNQSFPYTTRQRRLPPRRKSLTEAVKLAVRIIVANSTQPLHVISVLGFLLSALNVVYMLYAITIYFSRPNVVEGWLTQTLQTSGAFVFLFFMIAVLCEYVGRMLDEISRRPLYYIQTERGGPSVWQMAKPQNVVVESVEEADKPRASS